jgi:hypothetical protein
MIDPCVQIDVETLPADQVIAEIVRLAESSNGTSGREYARLLESYMEHCRVQKNREGIDLALMAISGIKCNFSRMSSALRSTYSVRNGLKHWYSTRDRVLDILNHEEPGRVRRLMIGLLEENPNTHEEMDGLDAWQSIAKAMSKYA